MMKLLHIVPPRHHLGYHDYKWYCILKGKIVEELMYNFHFEMQALLCTTSTWAEVL